MVMYKKQNRWLNIFGGIAVAAMIWLIVYTLLKPEPIYVILPAISQDDVMALYKSQLDKAEKDLNKEIIKRAVAGDHIKEAQEY